MVYKGLYLNFLFLFKRGVINFTSFFLLYIFFINFFVYICVLLILKTENMKFLTKKTDLFRGEVIGSTYIFDMDIEVTEDLSGEIIDYSGCGFRTAEKLIAKAKLILN